MFASYRKTRKPFVATSYGGSPQRGIRWHGQNGSGRPGDYDDMRFDDRINHRKAPNKSKPRGYNDGSHQHHNELNYDRSMLAELFEEFEYLHDHMDQIEDRLDFIIRRQKRSFR